MSDIVQSARDSDTHRALVDAMHRAVQSDELDPASNYDRDKLNPPSVTGVGHDEETVDPWGEGDSENERDWLIQPSRDEFEFDEGEGVDLRDPSLLDLLSNKPVPGAVLNRSGRTNTAGSTSDGVNLSKPMRFTASRHVF
ncbi:hypothetical protein FRC09_015319 [Ceratobasidium sp. 395]|nr:hypothetical protein FRC09_015319 [Ceratobasidium sp. 395]